MEIKPFLNNAEIKPEATEVVFECANGEEHSFSIEEAKTLIFKFSQEGKPLSDGGPVHLLLSDGSNVESPIKEVIAIRVQ